MKNLQVSIISVQERTAFGLWKKSDDHGVSADIKNLSAQYHRQIGKQRVVLPFFVLSRNYDERSGSFELFVGGAIDRNGLDQVTLSAGQYARMVVRPKLGLLWGASVGEAKRYFYTGWLPQSPWQSLNLEYEYHTEASCARRPSIELLFAIKNR